MEDDLLIGDLVERFVGRLPQRIKAMHGALMKGQWKELASHAHQMAGASGFYGFHEMGKLAENLLDVLRKPLNLVSLEGALAKFVAAAEAIILAYSQAEVK